MKLNRVLLTGSTLLLALVWTGGGRCRAQANPESVIRLAELEIDPSQIEQYRAALREEITASIAREPGVLKLYAVAVKGHPEQIRLFEMYSSPAAYEAHLASPHFKKYKAATQGMVRSLKLVETDPLLLGGR